MIELTDKEIETLLNCFENESIRCYGKVNMDAPLYVKLKEMKNGVSNPCWECKYRKLNEPDYINICLLKGNCIRE